jgi:hypothetical protein
MNMAWFLLVAVFIIGCWHGPTFASEKAVLEVHVDSNGTAHVHADVHLPGIVTTTHAVLVDYERWPLLFSNRLRVVSIKREEGRVVTDMYISRYFLPGELHLLTETRQPTPDRLETTLLEGDFVRYRRIWQLMPSANGKATQGHLDFDVALSGWVPHWLFAEILKREMAMHLERLSDEIRAKEHP